MKPVRTSLLLALAGCLSGPVSGQDPHDESSHPVDRKPNRLLKEKSVYLQQHAFNPVDWYPWGDEAFEKARAEDKPIFLSIGYSTCHWCHVMERESFEDEEIAAFLNEHFVSIKVDREERPDVDSIYMNYVMAIRGSGGWPLTAFLTADRVPFWGGTYFPPRRNGRMAGFLDVLSLIHENWRDDRDTLLQHNERVLDLLRARTAVYGDSGDIDRGIFAECFSQYDEAFDRQLGGRAGAPKFPEPMMMAFLLRYERDQGDGRALELARRTLLAMADGGIYDQLGGGFARYSVDARWLVPHFEKMLYSQALLSRVYAEAWQQTGEARFEEVARGVLDYVLRDMRLYTGAFAAAEDADSEGEEGLFYTWTKDELRDVLGKDLAEDAATAFGVTEFGHLDGRSVLHRAAFGAVDGARVEEARRRLFEARAKRVRPLRDDKVITAWNALMISSLAFCGRVFDEPRYVEAAQQAATFLRDKLYVDGELLRRWRVGEARGHGYLDDYAFFARALLDLYEADFDIRWLELGAALTLDAVDRFGDEEGVTFYDAPAGADDLIVRPRDGADGALPSATAVLCENLIRWSDWNHDAAAKERAMVCLKAYADSMRRAPIGYTEMINATLWALEPPREIVFAGRRGSADLEALISSFYRGFEPFRVLAYAAVDDEERARDQKILGLLEGKATVDGAAAAYRCENYACQAPVTDPADLRR